MKVPLMDLWAQHRALEPALVRVFRRSLRNSAFILGDALESFEKQFARRMKARHAVGVGSGTDALRLSLQVAGVGRGDEVIVPALTFAATAHAVMHAGGRPRFVDVDAETATLDPEQVARAVTRRTRAIIPVHLYGHPADMDALMRIARRNRLVVIEDACQAHGARWRGRPVGSFGAFGVFSFYPSKNLGALGDGGIVVTNSAGAARALRTLRHVGQSRRGHYEIAGFTSRLDAIQAALLTPKLQRLEAWNRARRRRAAWYRSLIRNGTVGLPVERPKAEHVYHLFVIRCRRRAALQKALKKAGVDSAVHYRMPVPYQPSMRMWKHRRGEFPVAEQFCEQNLAIPMFPELPRTKIEHVARVINRWSARSP